MGWLALCTLPLLGQATPAQAHPEPARKALPQATQADPTPPPAPIAQLTPEQMPAEAPWVSLQNGNLTVESRNSTLGDILAAIRRQTGAEIDALPGGGRERVAAHLSGSPRDVIAALLDGSKLGYVILGEPGDPNVVRKVVLTMLPAGGAEGTVPASASTIQPHRPQEEEEETPEENTEADRNPALSQPPQPPQVPPDNASGQPTGQPPEQIPPQPQQAGQPGAPSSGDQQGKTPEQLLQDLQRLRNAQNNPQTQNAPQQ